jgi:hypothetical protein
VVLNNLSDPPLFYSAAFAQRSDTDARSQNNASLVQCFQNNTFATRTSKTTLVQALKFVSFPTQVLAKASKVIPVMLMGYLVNGTTYPLWEYGCAAGLALGVAVFMFTKDMESGVADGEGAAAVEVDDRAGTSLSGFILLAGYLCWDRYVGVCTCCPIGANVAGVVEWVCTTPSFLTFFSTLSPIWAELAKIAQMGPRPRGYCVQVAPAAGL